MKVVIEELNPFFRSKKSMCFETFHFLPTVFLGQQLNAAVDQKIALLRT